MRAVEEPVCDDVLLLAAPAPTRSGGEGSGPAGVALRHPLGARLPRLYNPCSFLFLLKRRVPVVGSEM